MNNSFITTLWSSVRVNLHGKIENLSTDFEADGKPFSVFLVPTSGAVGDIVLLPVKLMAEDENAPATPCPVVAGDWCPLSIVRISASAAPVLNDYDIYWGRGY
jgi:hypothetical protein